MESVFSDGSCVRKGTVSNGIDPHQSAQVGCFAVNCGMVRRSGNRILFVLHNAEADGKSIGDLFDGVGKAAAGADAAGNIRHGGIEGSVFFVDCCGIDINHVFHSYISIGPECIRIALFMCNNTQYGVYYQ